MDKSLLQKIAREEPLSAEESLRLDQALDVQEPVANLVAHLPEDAPSLAWRSELNQRLAHTKVKRRQFSLFRWGSGALAAAAAVTALVVVVSNTAPKPAAKGSVEEVILSAHRDEGVAVHVDWSDSLDEATLGSL